MEGSAQYHVEKSKSGMQRKAPLLLGLGAALAASALAVQYRSKQAEQENPPTGRFIEVDGINLHYLEKGQGQPVVLLHGNGTMAQEFELSGLLDLVAEHYRVIAFDRPGYGYSERPRSTIWGPHAQAELLHKAMQQLGAERPIIVAHSWGTMVALALALDHPESVAGLVLMSGYYYPTPRMDVALLSPPAIPVIGDIMRYTVSPLIGRAIWPGMLKKLFYPAEVPHHFDRFPVWMALRPSQLRASAAETAMMIPAAASLSKRYRELKMPVMIMAGADDLHVSPTLHSQHLHREVPHSELHLTPGVGHMMHHMMPRRIAQAIDDAARAAGMKDDIPGRVHYLTSTQLH